MTDAINFTIPLPEAGPGAILSFDFADLVKLQTEFGPSYIYAVAKAMDENAPEAIRTCVTIATKAGDPESALRALPVSELASRLMDALSLRLSGKPFGE